MSRPLKTIAVGIVGFVLGGATVYAALKAKAQQIRTDSPQVSQPADPFQDFENRQRAIFKHFDQLFGDDDVGNPLNAMNSFPAMSLDSGSQESMHEDNNYVYYDIKVPDLKSTSIDTKVENGYITITGKEEKKNDHNGGESVFESSFHRTFPVPPNVDTSKMETSTEKGDIVLKFPKIKT